LFTYAFILSKETNYRCRFIGKINPMHQRREAAIETADSETIEKEQRRRSLLTDWVTGKEQRLFQNTHV
jgi:hypothetical protein